MASKKHSSVAVIILNWNGYAHTRSCLLSLEKISYPDYGVFVVDNGSHDGSGLRLQEEFPEVHFIFNHKNLGFTGGNLAGLDQAVKIGYEYFLLLNNDTSVEVDFLYKLMDCLIKDSKTGLVQPLILFQDSPDIIWSAGGSYSKFLGISKTLGDRATLREFPLNRTHLDWATGCCVLFSKKVLDATGGFANSFFAYFEDVDWSLRIRKAGYNILLAKQSIIYHEGSASSKQESEEGTLSPTVFYLHSRNQLFQLRRHHKGLQAILSWPYHLLKYLAWMSYFCLRGRFTKMKAVARGIRDGMFLDHRSREPLCP
ncbi:glycosyl transferase, family 2 [Indibacter alkaliphilus LW1]|uniref:Glycosyl transferase, family 2 n=1 Tax=Indibacter alkaliphilus (strain CCUG 57479 / KCTC 22604 / LW1) TaxID=1189612 RepID=S2D4P6_INDAL|nr:glycosyltransferase family 2 protein [Indibacter alkaliphilus]EOZ92020.1 glycosyl transferase, family 2 [Indibacter alkaliphilus LW1]